MYLLKIQKHVTYTQVNKVKHRYRNIDHPYARRSNMPSHSLMSHFQTTGARNKYIFARSM